MKYVGLLDAVASALLPSDEEMGLLRLCLVGGEAARRDTEEWLVSMADPRERLGAVLLKGKRFADAEKVFRADLTRNTGNPRSLYGLYRALEGQKKYAATETKESFEKAWAGADVTLGDDLYGSRR